MVVKYCVRQSMFAYHPEEVLYDNTGEPSPYELEMERLRMDKLLQSQVQKYGDDAMRTQPTIALDGSAMPTEDFQRSPKVLSQRQNLRAPTRGPGSCGRVLVVMGLFVAGGALVVMGLLVQV